MFRALTGGSAILERTSAGSATGLAWVQPVSGGVGVSVAGPRFAIQARRVGGTAGVGEASGNDCWEAGGSDAFNSGGFTVRGAGVSSSISSVKRSCGKSPLGPDSS